MDEIIWNPWHGCKKYSSGCMNCYVYRQDGIIGKDASEISKNRDFDLPLRHGRDGKSKIAPGSTVYTCMTSDFFIEEADVWRNDVWDMIKRRNDVNFIIITKRISRFTVCVPPDWGDGYENVSVYCTIENMAECDRRLNMYLSLPIKKKHIICEPLLERIYFGGRLSGRKVESVTVGGESGKNARICDYEWIMDIRRQCIDSGVDFYFKQTGAHFKKDGRVYDVPRSLQLVQAKKANINKYF